MERLSVIITTYNNELSIARCIDSVKAISDEIVVLDFYSTDKTVEIAQDKGAKIVRQSISSGTKEQSEIFKLLANNFVLIMDAAEELGDDLRQIILLEKMKPEALAYTADTRVFYEGKQIRWGLLPSRRKLRLFDRRIVRWVGANPRYRIELKVNTPIVRLKGCLFRHTFNSIDENVEHTIAYSTMAAQALHQKGKKSLWIQILIVPTWNFLLGYFIRLGFLDGLYGFVFAVNSSHEVFIKYAKLYQLVKSRDTNR